MYIYTSKYNYTYKHIYIYIYALGVTDAPDRLTLSANQVHQRFGW